MSDKRLADKVVLITGGARRVGGHVARTLHAQGMKLVLHYRSSEKDAQNLQEELHKIRPHSVLLVRGDLSTGSGFLQDLVNQAIEAFDRIDVLINNASTFYPTPIGDATEKQWEDLLGTNLKTPFFLAQASAPHLKTTRGCVINIADIYGQRPLKGYSIYSVAKAGLIMLTKALARELGPDVRVNAIAPGAILWPEDGIDEKNKQRMISRTPLKRMGDPDDIARAVLFLINDASFISGEVIAVDGGRRIVL
ncbi:MAG: pteridine reductase [Acidiferrobacterales bacterium]